VITKCLPKANLRGCVICTILGLGFSLALAACAAGRPSSVASGRPDCVSLPSYSGVIQQVMRVQPTWQLLPWDVHGTKYQWTIEDTRGSHTLTAALTPEGCVCATSAMSRFLGSQGETAGNLQGAAVAPISELDYTSNWLEPKLLLPCPLAFLLRTPYESEKEMPDATIWKLTCSRGPELQGAQLATSLTVASPRCVDAFD
jgi:hypothetical protein